MYARIRPLFFLLPPEDAHHLTLVLLRLTGGLAPLKRLVRSLFETPDRPVKVFGLEFRNPVGLAAGYDKDGIAWHGLASLGFGHIEVGTVTPRPQPGNPQPRLFRLPPDQALINRMGFPSRGAEFVLRHLRGNRPKEVILGVNLGKNKGTPLEAATEDYVKLLRSFAPAADYLAINVSSPNTPGLRRLQARGELEALLSQMSLERRHQEKHLGRSVPLLVKLAPDLSEPELEDALEAITITGMDGIIASNTTLSRAGVTHHAAQEAGGLSGAPLRARSTAMIQQICRKTSGKLPVIATGGILCAQDAREKLDAGAQLVQVYTGLVYAGPGLVKQIVSNLPGD